MFFFAPVLTLPCRRWLLQRVAMDDIYVASVDVYDIDAHVTYLCKLGRLLWLVVLISSPRLIHQHNAARKKQQRAVYGGNKQPITSVISGQAIMP